MTSDVFNFFVITIESYCNDQKQVHSLCVDSRPGDWLWTAKGPPSFFIIVLDTVWSSRPAFGSGREKKT